jgi:hypothetical protein
LAQLTIERRVLIVPGSTIPIAGIGDVSTGEVAFLRKGPLIAGLALIAAGLALAAVGAWQNGLLVAGGAGSVLGGLLTAAFLSRTEHYCLSIVSAGGHVFLFAGQRKTLEEARRLLTEKINSGDDDAVYRINFPKGIVHAVSHAEPLGAVLPVPDPDPGPHPGLNLGHNVSRPPNLPPTPLPPSLGPPRMSGPDLAIPVAGTPVPVVANGHYTSSDVHLDYAVVLPQIVDMQRFYAQRPDTQEIAERLNEMEFLMRSGTPTFAGRQRLGQLAGELSAILGAYPHVVQIFQQAARLAGL